METIQMCLPQLFKKSAAFRSPATSVLVGLCCLIFANTPSPAHAQETFNKYILKAVEMLRTQYGGKGYNISKAYTHDIAYGGGEIKASSPPWTMCVAAVAEVIVTAINAYVAETHDTKPYTQFPVSGWNRMRPIDVRSHIWVDPRLDSYGTADALVTFGVGGHVKFADLTPGSFINFNRTNKTGHAVVFMGFLDKDGKEFPSDQHPSLDTIAGFKYFSAQNRNSHGFGYGYGFFSNKNGRSFCPKLENGLSPDCGIEYSTGQKLLTTGVMNAPQLWSIEDRDRNLKELAEGLYVQTRSRGPFLGLPADLPFEQFYERLQDQDTMMLNAIYDNNE
jgi:hypothetical protein